MQSTGASAKQWQNRKANGKEPPRASTKQGTQTASSKHKARICIPHNTVSIIHTQFFADAFWRWPALVLSKHSIYNRGLLSVTLVGMFCNEIPCIFWSVSWLLFFPDSWWILKPKLLKQVSRESWKINRFRNLRRTSTLGCIWVAFGSPRKHPFSKKWQFHAFHNRFGHPSRHVLQCF